MNEVNLASVYEANLAVAKEALEVIHTLELPVEKGAQKAYDCMVAGKEQLAKDKEAPIDTLAFKTSKDKDVFLCAYTRDIADTLMATLFRINKLEGQEELVKKYYALEPKENIDRWALDLKQAHDAAQEVVKKQVEEQNAQDEEMREFQNILTGRAKQETTDGGSTAA